jgi:hypothetical protein
VNSIHEKFARPVYVAAVMAAMVGWVLALYQGLEWVLGA